MGKTNSINVIRCNFSDKYHLTAVVDLINLYKEDPMGGGEKIDGLQKLRLVDGLNSCPTSVVLLAIYKNRFVGLLVGFESFATFSVKKCINIHDIIVDPKFRGKGIGEKLMSTIIGIAEERDCSKVTLEVREDNTVAQNLYSKLGFKDCEPPMRFWVKQF